MAMMRPPSASAARAMLWRAVRTLPWWRRWRMRRVWMIWPLSRRWVRMLWFIAPVWDPIAAGLSVDIVHE
jgi:hypothetical protein